MISMTVKQLEERIEHLESKLAELQSALESKGLLGPNGWVRAMDRWAGDEDIQAVFAAASKLREAERAKVRKPKRKKRGDRS
jgi:hypothetical protein